MKSTTHIKVFKHILLIILIISFSLSCEKDNSYSPEYLKNHSEIANLSGVQIIQLASQSSILPSGTVVLVRYGVKAYRIEYYTEDLLGGTILASGLLLIPQTQAEVPLLSFQHGTIFIESQAPSYNNSELTNMLTVFASIGYVIAVPDFIGYGASKNIPHPYEHRNSLATSCRDMIRASKECLEIIGKTKLSNQLFLAGYSEGGYATMALFKHLQDELHQELPVTAVSAGAGAYNKTEFANWILQQNAPLTYINYFLWVLHTYNRVYPALNRPLSSYFNSPWAEAIAQNGPLITVESNPSILFKSSFIGGITNGTDANFLSALADNNCFNWRPLSPLKLIHGTADDLVPFFNSQTAYNSMIQNGATNVSLVAVDGGTHESTIVEFAVETLLFFEGYK